MKNETTKNWTVVWKSKTKDGDIEMSPNVFDEATARYLAASMEQLTKWPHRAMELGR